MSPIKQEIKTLAALQRELKNQRKTVNRVGDVWPDLETSKWYSPSQLAAQRHNGNREVLRNLYIAYAIIRGRDPKIADPNYDESQTRWKAHIDKLVEKYTAEYEALYSSQS